MISLFQPNSTSYHLPNERSTWWTPFWRLWKCSLFYYNFVVAVFTSLLFSSFCQFLISSDFFLFVGVFFSSHGQAICNVIITWTVVVCVYLFVYLCICKDLDFSSILFPKKKRMPRLVLMLTCTVGRQPEYDKAWLATTSGIVESFGRSVGWLDVFIGPSSSSSSANSHLQCQAQSKTKPCSHSATTVTNNDRTTMDVFRLDEATHIRSVVCSLPTTTSFVSSFFY